MKLKLWRRKTRVPSVEVLRCQPGDRLLISYDQTLTAQMVHVAREQWQGVLPEGITPIVVGAGVDVKVIGYRPDAATLANMVTGQIKGKTYDHATRY